MLEQSRFTTKDTMDTISQAQRFFLRVLGVLCGSLTEPTPPQVPPIGPAPTPRAPGLTNRWPYTPSK